MKIESLAELEKAVKLCRKLGVSQLEVDGIKLTMTDAEPPPKRAKAADKSDKIETEPGLTDEQYLFWSSDQAV